MSKETFKLRDVYAYLFSTTLNQYIRTLDNYVVRKKKTDSKVINQKKLEIFFLSYVTFFF